VVVKILSDSPYNVPVTATASGNAKRNALSAQSEGKNMFSVVFIVYGKFYVLSPTTNNSTKEI
jgi:hypothetical protein